MGQHHKMAVKALQSGGAAALRSKSEDLEEKDVVFVREATLCEHLGSPVCLSLSLSLRIILFKHPNYLYSWVDISKYSSW